MHQSLNTIQNLKPLYLLPDDPFAKDVLIPAFSSSSAVECMMGFFSSAVLASLAPGLATFINSSEGRFRLIVSPVLRSEDLLAIEEGVVSAEIITATHLDRLFVTEDFVEKHTLKCLAWLIRAGRIEIKIALMKAALFHPKVWLFSGTESEMISAHGSSNLTQAGLYKNIEQIAISASWRSDDQRYTISKLRDQFLSLWSNEDPNCETIDLPSAIRNRLVTTYKSETPPKESELQALYLRAVEYMAESPSEYEASQPQFSIPSNLEYEAAPYAHQGKAVEAWCKGGYKGILEMATGSGKTIASMICANRLYAAHKPLLIVVAAPYIPLIQQWCEEIEPFGITPINLTEVSGAHGRASELGNLKRRLRYGAIDVAVLVVTHRALSTQDFQDQLSQFDCASLLIADEAHNLGSEGFITNPPTFFDYRLGLSATPVRQYDDEGTEELFAFLGPIVFRYSLEEAIGHCLVEYDYHIHTVELTSNELDRWYELTERIKRNAWRADDESSDTYLMKLLRDRRAILENATNKIEALSACLAQENLDTLKHTLIYASDKAPEQLESVNALLNRRGILFHQLTHEETARRDETKRILKSFQDGTLSVLTAKRVLDEGVNIPQVQKAYILASTTVERQWVQRRGRLLRMCPDIGKTHSEIHDFVAVPPLDEKMDMYSRNLVRSELLRIQEFARLARNAGKSDGPLQTIYRLITAAYITH